MLINIKGKTEVLQDLEKAKKLIDEAGKILYHMPTKIEFEVGGTEKESDAIRPDLDNQSFQRTYSDNSWKECQKDSDIQVE